MKVIIIFAGQSNMQGQTEALSESKKVDGAVEYKYLSDEFTALKNPCGENILYDLNAGCEVTPETDVGKWVSEHALGASCYGNTNMVPEFCRAYIEKTGHEVIAVHAAKGSTVAAQWLPGEGCCKAFTAKCRAALKKAGENGFDGKVYLAWLQGESDAIINTSAETYKERLTAIKDYLVNELGLDCFGIVLVGDFVRDDRDKVIQDAQRQLCEESEDFIMLTEIAPELYDKPEYMNPNVGGHFSAAGQELLGRAAGSALADYVMKK